MKTIPVALVLAIGAMASTGCTTHVVIDGMTKNCPRSPAGKITAKDGELSINDKAIKACPTQAIVLSFKDEIPGTAYTMPKKTNDPSHAWLEGHYDSQTKLITIPVPMGTPSSGPDTDYRYTLYVEGIGQLDPRFVVL
jgi:hypothetical protein